MLSSTELDSAVTPILEKMSRTGVCVDVKFLEDLGLEYRKRLEQLESEIYQKAGHEFNINSPKQLGVVLFDELKLPVIRKTKTGRSTDEMTLLELMEKHPIVSLLVEYRRLYKLLSTYIDPLPKLVVEDGRIHSTFLVDGAVSGRISSQNPNLQNIPARAQGSEIRKAFVASPGKVLFGADYSQIELRIVAHLSGDQNLLKAFQEGLDIHAATAATIFKIPIENITKEQRTIGKTMNFATLYGQGPRALAQQLKISFEEAQSLIQQYFDQFPQIKKWMEKTIQSAKEKGYGETMWGRKRDFPEFASGDARLIAFAERAVINHPIQGTNADMIKKAMTQIDNELSKLSRSNPPPISSPFQRGRPSALRSSNVEPLRLEEMKVGVNNRNCCTMILQIHDELLFECNPKHINEITNIVREKMEQVITLSVPVIVELKTGQNWGEMKAFAA